MHSSAASHAWLNAKIIAVARCRPVQHALRGVVMGLCGPCRSQCMGAWHTLMAHSQQHPQAFSLPCAQACWAFLVVDVGLKMICMQCTYNDSMQADAGGARRSGAHRSPLPCTLLLPAKYSHAHAHRCAALSAVLSGGCAAVLGCLGGSCAAGGRAAAGRSGRCCRHAHSNVSACGRSRCRGL